MLNPPQSAFNPTVLSICELFFTILVFGFISRWILTVVMCGQTTGNTTVGGVYISHTHPSQSTHTNKFWWHRWWWYTPNNFSPTNASTMTHMYMLFFVFCVFFWFIFQNCFFILAKCHSQNSYAYLGGTLSWGTATVKPLEVLTTKCHSLERKQPVHFSIWRGYSHHQLQGVIYIPVTYGNLLYIYSYWDLKQVCEWKRAARQALLEEVDKVSVGAWLPSETRPSKNKNTQSGAWERWCVCVCVQQCHRKRVCACAQVFYSSVTYFPVVP